MEPKNFREWCFARGRGWRKGNDRNLVTFCFIESEGEKEEKGGSDTRTPEGGEKGGQMKNRVRRQNA